MAPRIPKKQMPVAIVAWKDHTSQDAWIDDDEFKDYSTLHTINSIGWLKEEDDEKVVLVGAVDTDRKGCSLIQTIGKAMIVEMKVGGKKRDVSQQATKLRGSDGGNRGDDKQHRPSEPPAALQKAPERD